MCCIVLNVAISLWCQQFNIYQLNLPNRQNRRFGGEAKKREP